MGILDRFVNLWNGFWGIFLTSAEQKNPEAVYEAAIDAQIVQHGELKKAVAGIVHLRNKIANEIETKEALLKELTAQIAVAVDTGEDDAAMVLIQQKNELEPSLVSLQADRAKVEKQAEEAKDSLIAFRANIDKLKRERDEMLAKKASADAQIRIQTQLDGLSMEADMKALENVRESIHKRVAEADVGAEINGSSMEAKLRKIKAKTGDATARAQLEEMKRARQLPPVTTTPLLGVTPDPVQEVVPERVKVAVR